MSNILIWKKFDNYPSIFLQTTYISFNPTYSLTMIELDLNVTELDRQTGLYQPAFIPTEFLIHFMDILFKDDHNMLNSRLNTSFLWQNFRAQIFPKSNKNPKQNFSTTIHVSAEILAKLEKLAIR